jgi:RHS repeat-associated protein
VTNAANQRVSYEYDSVGNVTTMVDARKNATADPADYTRKFTYDQAHRLLTTTDAANKSTSSTYDKDGIVTATTDQAGNVTLVTLDARGKQTEVKVPHANSGGIQYRITRTEYDQVGNVTKVTSPRGTATSDDPDDFAQVTVYDELNRKKETRTAYDKDDARYTTPDSTFYTYDKVGRLITVSAPPSNGQTVPNNTRHTYFDNAWPRTSTDPWDIVATYDYDALGKQTLRTITSAGGSASRTMSWQYYPDGKLKARSDDGVPVGRQVVLVDNSDSQNVTATGTWPTASTASSQQGFDYQTHAAGTGANTFAWQLNIPQTGTYEVFVSYPQVSGAATDAKFTIQHATGSITKTVNQAATTGSWVSLGSYSFNEGSDKKITLSDQATGTVVADAVKLVRDNTGESDTEKHDYGYTFDPNGNLTLVTDASPGARIDTYVASYTGLDQVQSIVEKAGGTVKNTTSFTYNENGAPLTQSHDKVFNSYQYDARDLLSTVVNGTSATDPSPKTTRFTYTDKGERLKETKGNGNTVDYTYFLDGLVHTQTEKKPDGTLVSDDTVDYDLNGNRTHEVTKKMNADNHGAYLNTTTDQTYDPRDRIASTVKTGDGAGTETYVHDANNNVVSQTVKGTTTTSTYNRNRLVTGTTAGVTSKYNYDPFGRLDTVTAAGTVLERNVYDGFDHVVENRKNNGTSTAITRYTFDPMDRTATKTTDAGSAKEKTTTFAYMGLSNQVLDEESAGKIAKSYQYSPWGERLSQTKTDDTGTQEDSYYGYNQHTDVDQLTGSNGDTKATYGYTAYGSDDQAQSSGVDKPDAADPTKEPYNVYRYNAKRWDQNSGTYDMGFRDYSPGLNRYLTRDMYNGALTDLNMGLDPWTGNRYAFGGGNPISNIEIDGHYYDPGDGGGSGSSEPVPLCTGANMWSAACEGQRPNPSTGFTVAPPVAPPIPFTPPPPAPPEPPPVTPWLRWAPTIALLLMLSGDTAQDPRTVTDADIEDKERGCAERTNSLSQIEYLPRDRQGRARGAFACLTPSATQLDWRPPATPPGYVPGVHERGHLIARQFGGTSDLENIVPMYPHANGWTGMEGIEQQVRDRLNRNERVFYAVIPRYAADTGPINYVPYKIDVYILSASGFMHVSVYNLP